MPTPIRKMKMMSVRKFRDEFPKLTEPVRVIRAINRGGDGNPEVIGVWTPEKRDEKASG